MPSRCRAKPKNILYVIPTLRVGGAEIDLIRRLPRMDPSRFRVAVCTFFERGELAENLTQAGIEVIGPLVPSRHKSRNVDARLQHLEESFRASTTKRLPAALSPIAGFARNFIKKVISVSAGFPNNSSNRICLSVFGLSTRAIHSAVKHRYHSYRPSQCLPIRCARQLFGAVAAFNHEPCFIELLS